MSPESDPKDREIEISRIYDAPPAVVFKAWSDAAQLKEWWAPEGFTNPVCEIDFRVGGAWRVVMRAPDGSTYPCGGVYQEIDEPSRLVFTNDATDASGKVVLQGRTTVLFDAVGERTKLTVRSRATAMVDYATVYLEGMQEGWSQSLEKLARLSLELSSQ